MKLSVQKRLAASVLRCSPKRVKLATERSADIKEAITKADIRGLVGEGLISKVQEKGVSRVRARKRETQKRKGLQKGPGKRKAKKTTFIPKKLTWMNKIRVQRGFLQELREKSIIGQPEFKDLYRKSKGGFFRSKRHIKLYIDEHDLAKKSSEEKGN